MIEAAVEKLDVKRAALRPPRRADRAAHGSRHQLLELSCPRSSPTPTARPDRVGNLHFFNPALVMRCVEVVRGPAHLRRDRRHDRRACPPARQAAGRAATRRSPGFVANRILGAVRDEAIRLLEEGVASVEAIDTACRTALGYPMGPFELMDLTGIDIGYHAKLARYADQRRPARPAQPHRHRAGRARRAGPQDRTGFYTYDDQGAGTPAGHETDTR